jgi:hypothetical protein
VNTAEVIAGEICGTAAFLGVAIGYPLLWLAYARAGVLKLAAPPKPRQQPAIPESTAGAEAGGVPAPADPAQQIRPAA